MSGHRWLVLVAMALVATPVLADEVKLKSGRTVKGFIVEDTDKTVRIETADGKTEKFKRDDVESVAESNEVGTPDIDKRLVDVDAEDASAIAAIAKTAKGSNTKGWNLVAKIAIRKNADEPTARELLGHMKVGEKWYTNKAEGEKAKKAADDKLLAAEGWIKFKDGWIKKEDKPLADKDAKAFTKDDNGRYRPTNEVMAEKGLTLVNGKWIHAGTPEDQEKMAKFKELMGEEVWIHTTPHFKLFMQKYPAEKIAEFGALLEKTYAWFVKEMNKPADHEVFRGNLGVIWVLKDKETVLKWFEKYRNEFSLGDQFKTLLERGGGDVTSARGLLATVVPSESEDIRNQLVHVAGHYLVNAFSPGLKGTPSWLDEGVAHHAEDIMLGNGGVNCSTLAKYASGGGVAQKEFSTKDGKDRAKGLVRDGSDEAFVNLNKLDLNSLNGDHLCKGWTLVSFLLKEHHDGFVAWMEGMNTAEVEDALKAAIKDWTADQLDAEWRKYVKSNF